MRVDFFGTCLVEMLRPDVGAAAERVLRARGHDPQPVRGATCCGQPAYNAGYGREARRVARRTLRALGHGEGPCVVASGSCATMMSHHWPDLFDGTAEAGAARRVAARTVELTGFLAGAREAEGAGRGGRTDEHDRRGSDEETRGAGETGGDGAASDARESEGTGDTAGGGGGAAGTVVVHDSCHALRELGAGASVRRALSDAGRFTVETPDADGAARCCGFGGSFSVKLPDVSVAMADEKLDTLAAAGCEQVTSCDLSCLLHLEGRARRRGLGLRFDHVATLLEAGT